ncbi:YecA family protein [Sinanaerobacter chloroacetimidivorans]|uniref:YecA family protein n=1 Tax=Sinanaerobacter chloroacetimidivorans TaxID=2818044 RepID=UPI001D052A9B|nr:SEC-C metal-binding domain-containing protein [Sinanaerobacter chloroacetimidivorans]
MTLTEVKESLSLPQLSLSNDIPDSLRILKETAINSGNEELANEIWCVHQIFHIQNLYIKFFAQIKDKKFEESWLTLERIDIEFSFLRTNYVYTKEQYNLGFIEGKIKDWEKLYPYEVFFSRETIIKGERCSICGKKVSIRSGCGHRIGKLYMGELCCHEITDMEFLGMAIVTNPFDKYTFVRPQDMEYNYEVLELLSERVNTPYDSWHIETSSRLRPEYTHAERNKPCPCGSGEKYKKCCYGTKKELMAHNRIVLENGCKDSVPVRYVGTWK